ncbi:MAG TPA: nucleoside hydrolase [Acidimicrobiales bacterium]|nr:nucleoside hydrolase [Acidimicrobiales bacterium]
MRIHLDTDFGGDPDDACALALLLATRDVDVTGITTNLDDGGERAGLAQWFLRLCGRFDVPVIAGAATASDGSVFRATEGDERYWPEPTVAAPGRIDDAVDALGEAVDAGTTIVTIGVLTNLAALERARPGALERARVVTMGGWLGPLAPGLPEWGPERDFNLQCDRRASEIALRAIGDLTLVTLPATAVAHLRRAHLPRLRAAGRVGEVLAAQAEAYASDLDRASFAREHAALPDDLLNFHWDPVTCAVATGWDGVVVEERDDVAMRGGRPTRAVVEVDGDAFSELFIERIERLP